jgi:hypothetical protein
VEHEHWVWILLGALVAAPIWIVFGIVLWVKWIGRRLHDLFRDMILNWPKWT